MPSVIQVDPASQIPYPILGDLSLHSFGAGFVSCSLCFRGHLCFVSQVSVLEILGV